MKRKKLIVILAVVVLIGAVCAAAFLPKGRGDGEKDRKAIDPPMSYCVGGVDVAALPVLSEEISVYREKVRKEAESGEDAGEDSSVHKDSDTLDAVVYHYEGLEAPSSLVAAYAALMDTADTGFSIVDDALVKTDSPDYEAEEGSIHLARNGAEEGKVMSIQIVWSKSGCTVTAGTLSGEVTEPPVPEAMTISEVEDYVRTIPPTMFGLEGTSMQEYNIYVIDGTVLVDGIPCIRLNVYHDDGEAATNEIAGNYFISADKEHIYRLDVETGIAEEVG